MPSRILAENGRIVRAVLADVLLILALLFFGCDSDNNNNLVIPVPVRTPTATGASVTPTAAVTPTGVASITPTATSSGITPTPTATATPAKVALWVENSANGGTGSVNEFTGTTLTSPGVSVPAPSVKNTSADVSPNTSGINFDAAGNQWVSVCGSSTNHGSIAEFDAAAVKNLKTTPAPTANVVLSDDTTGKLVNCPWATVFDPAGDMWVANSDEFTAPPGFVTMYQPGQLTPPGGHLTPFATLTDTTEFVSPTGVVMDSGGNLFVSDFGPAQFSKPGAGQVFVFAAANLAALKAGGTHNLTSNAKLKDSTTVSPVNAAFDNTGNLWVADCGASELYEFAKGTLTTGATSANAVFKATTVTIVSGNENSLNCPGGITFDGSGNLWYTNFFSKVAGRAGAAGEFTAAQVAAATGTTTPSPTIFLEGDATMTNFDFPLGLTFGPQS